VIEWRKELFNECAVKRSMDRFNMVKHKINARSAFVFFVISKYRTRKIGLNLRETARERIRPAR